MSTPARRLALIAALAVVTALPFAFAAGARPLAHAAPLRPAVRPQAALVVPDVTGGPYVFAKETLEDAGFAWYAVNGGGYATNTVVGQSPAPGTRVVDTGAPLVRLRIERNRAYSQRGRADNKSPYHGTAVRLAAS
jgi:PASTA domain